MGRLAGLFVFAMALLLAGSVLAGSFPQEQGHGVVIVTTRFSGSSRAFDPQGKLIPVSTDQKFELTAYAEYGWTDRLTLFVQPGLRRITDTGPPAQRAQGLDTGEIGARFAAFQFGQNAVSVQASVLTPGSFRPATQALGGEAGVQVDGRIIYGRNFALLGWPAFLDLEAGYRLRPRLRNEVRLDMTLGLRPWERLLLLLQTFTRIAVGSGPIAAPRGSDQKVQLSAVYDLTKDWSVQVGGFAVVGALNARRESGLLGGVWYRF